MTTAAKIKALQNVKKTGTLELPDDLNPDYLFSCIATELLVQIISGEINPKDLAYKEIRNRGLDPKTGLWIGFDKH